MNYLGVTIGPIVETMMQTSSPAGLWFASYFFSTITRDLCMELQEKEYDVFTLPAEYKVREHLEDHIGTGTYHDRIYACVDRERGGIRQDVEDAIRAVIGLRAEELADCTDDRTDADVEAVKTELRRYLQIHYVIMTEEQLATTGVAKTLADALDALELSETVVGKPGESQLFRMIRGNEIEGANVGLKKYAPLKKAAAVDGFRLAYKEHGDQIGIHSLYYLSSHGKAEEESRAVKADKAEKYFAIVQCDGDNMGKLLGGGTPGESFEDQKAKIRNFSKHCMDYTVSSSAMVTEYGGFVIYAGGDDLLFLAPLLGESKEDGAKEDGAIDSVLTLCERISENFNQVFSDYKLSKGQTRPSISFGISVNYYKFPLYEAFQDGRNLLFGTAKGFTAGRSDTKKKNNVAVKLHKASGQTSGFVCCMDTAGKDEDSTQVYRKFLDFLRKYILSSSPGKKREKDDFMRSATYHLEEMKELFEVALLDARNAADEEQKYASIQRAFRNVFDNEGQLFGGNMLADVADLTVQADAAYGRGLLKGLAESDDAEKSPKQKTAIDAVTSMLRVAKFFVEEG